MTPLRVFYADEHLVVVDKPSGLLSVPGRGSGKADCAVSRAAAEFGWIREAHRLDQPTSGLLLLARSPEAHRRLSAAFAERRVRKTYIAVCASRPFGGEGGRGAVAAGRIVLRQRLDPENRPRQVVDEEQGKEAVTLWRVLDSGMERCRLELRPLTGRTHQLRLACAEAGAPILGDALYAPPGTADAADRLLLHAASIRFPAPFGGGRIVIESPAPF